MYEEEIEVLETVSPHFKTCCQVLSQYLDPDSPMAQKDLVILDFLELPVAERELALFMIINMLVGFIGFMGKTPFGGTLAVVMESLPKKIDELLELPELLHHMPPGELANKLAKLKENL